MKYFTMPEIIIKYKNKKTLEALQDLSKHFDFSISILGYEKKRKKLNPLNINGITIIPTDSSVDTSDLTSIFTGKDINPQQLRKEAWQRAK